MKPHRAAAFAPALVLSGAFVLSACDGFVIGTGLGIGRISGHEQAQVAGLTDSGIETAKERLDIVYWHTSHGSQITDGLAGMDEFYGGTGLYAVGGADAPPGSLRYDDRYETDLGDGDWDAITRAWLDGHPRVNVVMWSWCGQVSDSDEDGIADYLARMSALEEEYPGVRFVYMTGHADGTGEEGNLHARNLQIREYCERDRKFLFDFYDIECYDPDGVYYGDRHVDDACGYDGGNWALDWQEAHPGEWWECGSAHSQPLNANQKAKAAWHLFVSLARSL